MKSLLPLAAVLAATPLVVLACAQGSTADDVPAVSNMTTATAPTEPAKEDDPGKPIPNTSDGEDTTGSEAAPDAGKKTASDAGKDSSSSAPDAAPAKPTGKPVGKPCSATSECEAKLTCAYGTCRPSCTTEGTACVGAGLGVCEKLFEAGKAVPNTFVCAVTCDLQKPTTACGSNTCVWDSTTNTTDCDKPGSLDAFSQCSSYNACKPGLACVNNQLYGTECEPWCRIGVAGDCPILSSCIDVYREKAPMQGSTKLGLCQ